MKIKPFFLKPIIKLIFLFLILATLVFTAWFIFRPGAPEKPDNILIGDYSYAINYTDYQIKDAMKKYKIPGVIFAMIDGNDTIFSEAYGYADIANEIEATADTIFKAGSISKVFTGIEVMQLDEKGLIDITNPISDYLHNFKINSRFTDSNPISVESILNHRSGLPRGGTLFLWDWSSRPLVLDAQAKSLSESHMVYPNNYRYKYSNIGYNVLARMIETVNNLEPPSNITAGAFPYYMQENFFSPLGMNDTSFGSSMLLYGYPSINPSAMGYYYNKGKNIPYNQFDIISMASGNVHTTLNDMITFTKILLSDDNENLISSNIKERMFYFQSNSSRDLKDNGLTWFRNSDVLNEMVIFHDGTNQGFISMLAMIPEQNLGMIIIANSEEFENIKSILSFDILRVMLEAKTGSGINDIVKANTVSISELTMQSYTGKYLMNDEIIDIKFKNGKLKAKYKGFSINLEPIDENTFSFKNPLGDSVETRLNFFQANNFEGPYMILEMGDAFFCPKYPQYDDIPFIWKTIKGEYTRKFRHPSEYSSDDNNATINIVIDDGILMLKESFAILPVSDDRLLIQGGVFHGETMEYNSKTGVITWQHLIYEPNE